MSDLPGASPANSRTRMPLSGGSECCGVAIMDVLASLRTIECVDIARKT